MKSWFHRSCLTFWLLTAISVVLVTSTPRARADEFGLDDEPISERLIQTITLTLPNGGDQADVHFPNIPAQLRATFTDAFPIIVLLQGANVNKDQYKPFARRLARRGFVVVVANHFRVLGPPGTPPSLFTSTGVITNVLTKMQSEDGDSASPLNGIVDTNTMGLVGHSFGGVAGLFASAGLCIPPFCETAPPFFPRPAALKAAAFYGTDLAGATIPPGFSTTGVAVALLQGSRDSLSTPAESAVTYPLLAQPRALITINGANHYGICKDNNPTGAAPDLNPPALEQSEAISRIAQWASLWLRSQLKNDAIAKFRIYQLIRADDDDVQIQTN